MTVARPQRSLDGAGSDSTRETGIVGPRSCRVIRIDGHRGGPVLDSIPGGDTVSARPSNPGDPDAARTRCVLLVSPGETPPQPLLDILRDQTEESRHLVRAEHPLLALAHLATCERARLMRRDTLEDWPPRRPEKTMLVVVNREAWPDLSPLFASVRQLMPAVAIWVCTERIAIEIYSGEEAAAAAESFDASTSAAPPSDPLDGPTFGAAPTDHPSSDVLGDDEDRDEGLEMSSEITDEEMRDLLDRWNAFEDDDHSEPDSGAPHTP